VSVSVDLLIDAHAELAEGPRWDAVGGRLLWVDIEGGKLYVNDKAIDVGARIGACAPCDDGDVLLALQDRLALLSGATLAEFPWPAGIRANDGACDSQGRFWVGSMALDQRPGAAALYRCDGRELVQQLDALTIANGIGWSPDDTRMYYIDTPTKRVDVFAYEDGEISDRRTFARIERGSPDGLAVDDEGCVWVALYGGGAVQRFTPGGALDRTLEVPATNVTACCFYDGSLVLTGDGQVWIADVGIGGPPAQPFRSTAPSEADETSAR
jgi:sugar lactone lactonase YvrE